MKTEQKRERALSLKEFYSLSVEEANKYLLQLFSVPTEERTAVDKHILKFHNIKPALVEEFYIDF